MLSPHELSKLLIALSNPDELSLHDPDVDALEAEGLLSVASGETTTEPTAVGKHLVDAMRKRR
jgi:hypothetical protein